MKNEPQGQVCIQSAKGNLSFQLPSVYALHYYGIKQKYISFGAKDNRDNARLARDSADRMQDDLEAGKFDPNNVTRYKHPNKQIKGRFQPKTEASSNVLELGEEFIKHLNISITTRNNTYRTYVNYLKKMESTCGYTLEQQLEIKTWIQINASSSAALGMLSLFNRIIEWGKQEGRLPGTFISKFKDYATQFKKSLRNVNTDRKLPKYVSNLIPRDGIKAWTEQERDIIIAAFYSRKRIINKADPTDYIASLIEFLFNVGCRHGEAFALTWGDITDNFTFVNIDKSYSSKSKIVKGTKTGKNRLVRLNLRLQEMLKNLKPVNASSSDLIFKTQKGGHLQCNAIQHYWHPKEKNSVLGNLIKEGKLATYLDAYSTRRTFVSIQINKGIPVPTVAKWVGDDAKTLFKHYARHNDDFIPY